MPYLFTSESVSEGHPDKVADQIFDRFPDDVKAAQAGTITKEAAIAKIRFGGATQEQAEMIYQSIMDTDFEAPEEAKP